MPSHTDIILEALSIVKSNYVAISLLWNDYQNGGSWEDFDDQEPEDLTYYRVHGSIPSETFGWSCFFATALTVNIFADLTKSATEFSLETEQQVDSFNMRSDRLYEFTVYLHQFVVIETGNRFIYVDYYSETARNLIGESLFRVSEISPSELKSLLCGFLRGDSLVWDRFHMSQSKLLDPSTTSDIAVKEYNLNSIDHQQLKMRIVGEIDRGYNILLEMDITSTSIDSLYLSLKDRCT